MPNRIPVAFGLFLVALTTLLVELVLIRVFDVILSPNLGYMIITSAMFAFGLAGVYVALRPQKPDANTRRILRNLTVMYAIACVLLLPVINWIPFDFGVDLSENFIEQTFYFGILYVVLVIPFFFGGLVFTRTFSAYASHIRPLYFFDLCGAAVGAIILIPFLPIIGPGGLLFLASGFALIAAGLFATQIKFKIIATGIAVAMIIAPFLLGNGYYEFKEHMNKRNVAEDKGAGNLEYSKWDPISKIDVINIKYKNDRGQIKEKKHIAYDGGNQSSFIYPFNGNYQALRNEIEEDPESTLDHFWNPSVLLSHALKADTGSDVLVMGSAGGQETKAALVYGANHVDAIELVGTVVEIGENRYQEYNGGIFLDPRVKTYVTEGRSFLRRYGNKYDIIQIYSNHTSSSIASGNISMGVAYLQTVEAYKEYFSSLKPDGILQINHHIYPRMLTAASAAWKEMGRGEFRKHVMVFSWRVDTLPAVLIKMQPWTKKEVLFAKDFIGRMPKSKRLVENPLDPGAGFLSDEFFTGAFPQSLADSMPYHAWPSTDDRPYFKFLRKHLGHLDPDPATFTNESVTYILNGSLLGGVIPMDVIRFFIVGAGAFVFTLAFILIPLLFSRVGHDKWNGKFPSLIYFSCLGAGFIIIEITFIHLFMKLIGFPLYSYSTVIFTMLFAAGIGSLSAKYLDINPNRLWWVPFTGTVIFGAIVLLINEPLFNLFLTQTEIVRILVAGLTIFPMAFFMGMAFPLGILTLEHQPAGAIAWAWGMNGLFTVIGGLLSAVLSIFIGFKLTILLALVIYSLAGVTFSRFRKTTLAYNVSGQ